MKGFGRLLSAWDKLRARMWVCTVGVPVSRSGLRDEVVVTLTTYPARIKVVHRTLISLIRQIDPALVVLYLSTADFPTGYDHLPRRLKSVYERAGGRLEIRWLAGNSRSYKKLIPAISDFGDRMIVTADDDVIYWRTWLNELVNGATKHPRTVVGTRGTVVEVDESGQPKAYDTWRTAPAWCVDDRVFLTGRGGILYPPGALDEVAEDVDLARKLAPTADDIWFKAMTMRSGYPAVRVPVRREYPSNGASQREGLYKSNVGSKRNDIAVRDVFAYFGLSFALGEKG